jgi:hypothetical protein
MVLTCSLLPATLSTPEVIGWAAKPLSVCKPDRLGPVNLVTTGRLLIGFRSTTPTPIWEVSVPQWSMCPARRLRNWCLRLVKIQTPTWLIVTISVVSLHLWLRLMSPALTEEHLLSPIGRTREHIFLSITSRTRLEPTRLPPQVRRRSRLLGAKARLAEARRGSQRLTVLMT